MPLPEGFVHEDIVGIVHLSTLDLYDLCKGYFVFHPTNEGYDAVT